MVFSMMFVISPKLLLSVQIQYLEVNSNRNDACLKKNYGPSLEERKKNVLKIGLDNFFMTLLHKVT